MNLLSRRDLDFILFELLQVEQLTTQPRFADHSAATFGAALDAAFAVASERFAPHNQKGDANEAHHDGERVQLIPEVKQACDAFIDAGFLAASHDFELGGMQLPFTVALACWGVFKAANVATEDYLTLTIGVANLVQAFGSAQQQARYLNGLLDGRYFGTMVLTEPQAGSSLADIQTSATPLANGHYAIRGNKIFITAGDHELADNILHMVLARIAGAPPGVAGLSLFIVPKYRLRDDGTRGERNDVALAGLFHKMGFRGTSSAALNFGEQDRCEGELVGQPHQGLAMMFQMMNAARIGVGLSAAALGYTAYLHALDYARNRPQGRLVKNPATPQVPIVCHADVRRMLLRQKSYVEGALALSLYAGWLSDCASHGDDVPARQRSSCLLDLLTPVVKAWCSRYCTEANDLAIQVYGGYGYMREFPVEQFYRDNRLNALHEGTNGIQALDLLGRKVFAAGGAAFGVLESQLMGSVDRACAAPSPTLRAQGRQLAAAWQELTLTTAVVGSRLQDDGRAALTNASAYMETFGHTIVAWLWLRQALLAEDGAHGSEAGFYRGKLAAAAYFFDYELAAAMAQHPLIRRADAPWTNLPEQSF